MIENKKIAVDYKGKHFIIQDTLDDYLDEEVLFIDVDKIISNPVILKTHVYQCIYYGIPAYIGRDDKLKTQIAIIEKEYDEENKL